jgi:catechol 2,3-dioxygenase-like lactoylglutathione lyase family enzyme
MKTHLNFSTSDVDRSVGFYGTLLNAAPVKHYGKYALFVTEDPGLELALQADSSTEVREDAHYGLVTDAHGVEDAIARLRTAGLPVDVRSEETCCYAVQTKVWTNDPDGRRWEVYTVHEELGPSAC